MEGDSKVGKAVSNSILRSATPHYGDGREEGGEVEGSAVERDKSWVVHSVVVGKLTDDDLGIADHGDVLDAEEVGVVEAPQDSVVFGNVVGIGACLAQPHASHPNRGENGGMTRGGRDLIQGKASPRRTWHIAAHEIVVVGAPIGPHHVLTFCDWDSDWGRGYRSSKGRGEGGKGERGS